MPKIKKIQKKDIDTVIHLAKAQGIEVLEDGDRIYFLDVTRTHYVERVPDKNSEPIKAE